MVAAVRVHKVGGPEVLTYEEIELPAPGQGQVRVKQHAAGVNFIDTYFRMGMYPSPVGLPFTAGNEGAGEVIAVGPGVTDLKVGDRVAYVVALGCYASERIVPADRAVKLPANISYEQAAAMMLKGMTAEYLLRRTFKVDKGMNVFVHAAAGGVGLILCQWANHLGATVIGTVGSKEKAALAKANGCHHTILYRDEDFAARAKEITGGKLCEVRLRWHRQDHVPGLAGLPQAARLFRQLRQRVRTDRCVQHQHSSDEGLAVRDAADVEHLRGQTRRSGLDRQRAVRRCREGRGENSDPTEIRAKGCRQSAPRSRGPRHHGLLNSGAVTLRCLKNAKGP